MKPLPPDLDLSTRKLMLQQRSAVLRELLAVQWQQTTEPVRGGLDRAQRAGSWLKQHPLWVGAVVLGLIIWRPKGVARWMSRGLSAWQAWQHMSPVVERWLKRGAPGHGAASADEPAPR